MMLNSTQVQVVRFWMGHFKSMTSKRHYCYSNSPEILRFDKGVLSRGWNSSSPKVATAKKYIDKQGKCRYQGTSNLKKTENHGSDSITSFFDIFSFCWIGWFRFINGSRYISIEVWYS